MNPKAKMYTTLALTTTWTVALLASILFGGATQNEIDAQELENQRIQSELGITETWSQVLIDTESKVAPEIIVNEAIFDKMPQVDEELTAAEASSNRSITLREKLPDEINLAVPFYPQAPDGDWSLPWKEACEESSFILAYYYLQWKELSKETFKKEVLDVVELEKKMFGKYIDTSVGETAQVLEEFYDYTNYEILENPSIEDLKRELAAGHPIIAPFAGKELGNSFFTNGGPRYHMLVIVGYTDGFFLTNDVGTKRGENFTYSFNTIMDSMHDLIRDWEWDIRDGAKRVLVMR